MRRETTLFRLAALATTASLSVSLLPPARAQTSSDEVSPPARVGALTSARGTVSFHAEGADAWSPAAVNYPVTSGEGFWTEPGAEARIDLSATDLVMNGGTEIEVNALDERSFTATLPQGEAYLRLRALMPGETYTLVTPRGAVTIAAPGRYAVIAGDTEAPTRITVLEGAATLTDGLSGDVPAGQTAEVTGAEAPFQIQLVTAARDPFVDHVLDEERPRPARTPPPPLVAQMPGGAELADYGAWSQTPQYGQVWYPEVHAGWVPYREGHWAYVAPWGWTWVDADPWGFAPFHYGRWVDIDGRWAWAPGRSEPVAEAPSYPVYAPALVTFFGIGAAVGVTAVLLSSGSVGWVPLGPGEAYRPWFHAGPRYERDVNVRNVANVTQITNVVNTTNNNVTINQFRNVAGATVVPAAAMATSRPVASEARPATPQILAAARPVIGRQPVPPTTATAGVTPAVARAVQAVPPPAGIAPARPAPGPVIRAQAQAPGVPGAAARPAAVPPLRHGGTASPPAGQPAGSANAPGIAGGHALAAAPAASHPAETVPALRPPGARPPVQGAEARVPESAHAPPSPNAVARSAPTIPPAMHATPATHAEPASARPVAPPAPMSVPHAAPAPGPHVPISPGASMAPPTPHPVAPSAIHPAVAAPVHPAAPPALHQAPPAQPVHPQAPVAPAVHPAAPAPIAHPAPVPAPAPPVHPAPVSVRPEPPHAPAPPPPAPHPAPAAQAPVMHAAAPHPAPHQEKRPGQP